VSHMTGVTEFRLALTVPDLDAQLTLLTVLGE
jgi:hypothetical protein